MVSILHYKYLRFLLINCIIHSVYAAVLPINHALATRSTTSSAIPNVAVYWGQNSKGLDGSQKSLATYCESDSVDIIILSFLITFFGPGGMPVLNFGNACEGAYFQGTDLLSCPNIGADIQTCQSKGKQILLSLGGAVGSYGFSSDAEAVDFADQLWNLFGGGSSNMRPFGKDVIVDGFDLDIEAGSPDSYGTFINRLRQYFALDTSRQYHISTAPQCPFPDAMLTNTMTEAPVDYIFVQFYNNYCGMQTWTGASNAPLNPTFNYYMWDEFVKTKSRNPDAKVFLGVPASSTAAGSGYVDADVVLDAANYLASTYDTFGGVMMWDASQAWNNIDQSTGQNFAEQVKKGMIVNNLDNTVAMASSMSTSISTSAALLLPTSVAQMVSSVIAQLPTTTATVPAPQVTELVTSIESTSISIFATVASSISLTTLSKAFLTGGPSSEKTTMTIIVTETSSLETAQPTGTGEVLFMEPSSSSSSYSSPSLSSSFSPSSSYPSPSSSSYSSSSPACSSSSSSTVSISLSGLDARLSTDTVGHLSSVGSAATAVILSSKESASQSITASVPSSLILSHSHRHSRLIAHVSPSPASPTTSLSQTNRIGLPSNNQSAKQEPTPSYKHSHSFTRLPVVVTPTAFRSSATLIGPFFTTVSDVVEEYFSYYEPDSYTTVYISR